MPHNSFAWLMSINNKNKGIFSLKVYELVLVGVDRLPTILNIQRVRLESTKSDNKGIFSLNVYELVLVGVDRLSTILNIQRVRLESTKSDLTFVKWH